MFRVYEPAAQPEGIPLLPISAMAGAFTGDMTVLEYESERYVIPAFRGADFLIPVKGSSMYPKYSSGDLVACKRIPMTDLFFQWNKVYVLDTDQGALIKRICPGSSDDTVLIVSTIKIIRLRASPFCHPCRRSRRWCRAPRITAHLPVQLYSLFFFAEIRSYS